MLTNTNLVAKIRTDTAENRRYFGNIFEKVRTYLPQVPICRPIPRTIPPPSGAPDAGTAHHRPRRRFPSPKLKGSIGEGSNHSNFSHQSSVKIRSKFSPNSVHFVRKFKTFGKFEFQHFLNYRRNSDNISSKSEQNQ